MGERAVKITVLGVVVLVLVVIVAGSIARALNQKRGGDADQQQNQPEE